ncbi:unnamed protein product [Dibothriocephalus latus]|uniref:Tuftelin interacting protein N-terminal domain-containing protein n=1 Tax=Dibothriocephalus latus TaxID=60516 RepID=A0A3P7LGY7_DIBLA|nr:unnamed protein product [Dibothriocephalus latus]
MMDSSPEMERFGISEADYEYMFDPLKRKRFSSKKQQIYGVFASDSDSDAEPTGMGSVASLRKRKGGTYSGPVTFVSGGVKEGTASKPEETTADLEISDEEEDKELSALSRSTELSSGAEKHQSASHPSTYRSRKVAAALASNNSGGIGSWERHTRGIAGLPRYKKKSAARETGSQKPRAPSTAFLTADEVIASVSPATPMAAIRSLGSGRINSDLSKVKVIDMTTREQRVYDGYEAALSSSLRHSKRPEFADQAGGPDDSAKQRERRVEGRFFEVPVLCHNIDLVIQSTEDEIRRLDRAARFEEDRSAGLEHEIERLTDKIRRATSILETTAILLCPFSGSLAASGWQLIPMGAFWSEVQLENNVDLPVFMDKPTDAAISFTRDTTYCRSPKLEDSRNVSSA